MGDNESLREYYQGEKMNSSAKLERKLTEMEFYFTQYEIESKASDCLQFGDVEGIAELVGVSPSLISQMFNPHDERKSNLYKAIKEICAELKISQERGKALYCVFRSAVELHIKSDKKLCINTELEKADKEFGDIWKSRLKGKTPGEQITEIEQAEAQLKTLKRAVAQELQGEAEIQKDNFSDIQQVQTGIRRF